jgi:hypothetical protein
MISTIITLLLIVGFIFYARWMAKGGPTAPKPLVDGDWVYHPARSIRWCKHCMQMQKIQLDGSWANDGEPVDYTCKVDHHNG